VVYTLVSNINEISTSNIKPITIAGKEILIINYDNQYYVINRKCTHFGGDLSRGKLVDGIITCPNHGSKFDIKSGKSISGPKIGFLKLSTKDIKTYNLKVENNLILIDL